MIFCLSKPFVPFSFDRKEALLLQSYWVGLLNGFLDRGQAYHLNKLRFKYPTCRKLYSAFPVSIQTLMINLMGRF